ncbi:uncharacterized protein LOC113956607 [Corapipo altera]|uniref:uncharacterized protein LOC113956607 n=1 Tax=Corapipo altera TaxID=415028 RepID=UPI000FD68FF7|nr:uncharacterized protein LOC113956607 [Corapipo altera]
MKTTYLVFGTKGAWLISPVIPFLCCLFMKSLLRCTQITTPSSSECNNLLKLFVHRTVHKPWDETEVLFVCSGKLFMSREAPKSSKIQLPQILFFLLQRNVTARCFTHNLEKVCLHSQMKSCQVPVHYHRMKTLSWHKKNWKKSVLLVLVLPERFCHPATCRSGLRKKTPKYERGVLQLIPQPRSAECWKHVKHPALQSSSLESRS